MMRRGVTIGIVLAALALGAMPSAASEMEMEKASESQRALSLQALALLDAGRAHEEAEAKLDDALKSKPDNSMDLRALREAHAALHKEDAAQGKRLLEAAFPKGHGHVVGTVFRPDIQGSRIVAGVIGAILLLLAAAALMRTRHRRPGGADGDGDRGLAAG